MPEKRAFLATIPPFDRLRETALGQVAQLLSSERFASGQTILKRWANPAYLYIVYQGEVEELDLEGTVARHASGDSFDARALIEGRSQHTFVARGECRCYRLPAQPFLAMIRVNPTLGDYYYEDISHKLDTLVTVQQQREAASLMMSRISDAVLRPPVYVDPDTSAREAVELMKTRRTSALLLKRHGDIGIFTSRDVREKLVLARQPETTPVGGLANFQLITLEPDDFLLNALKVMTQQSIRHLVIVQNEEIVGVLEQIDLLNYLSSHSHFIGNQIERARSPEDLSEASEHIPQVIKSLYERGVKCRYISRLVTDLNRRLMQRLYELVFPPALANHACLIVMGSEGRGEQLLRTDQDNALILRDSASFDDLPTLTQAFTERLVALGYPPCPGNIMVSNPAWAKPLESFKNNLLQWIHKPDENAFMNLAIFYDASVAAGDASLLETLKDHLFYLLRNHTSSLQHFARAILAFDTPLGLFNRFILERAPHARQMDIKKGGIFPIVHGIRSLALEQGLSETNTIMRIQALSGRGLLDDRFTGDLIEAFEFISMLRLRVHMTAWENHQPTHNYLYPRKLNKLERDLLKESLKIVKELKNFVSYHFKLRMVS
ncbi:MAG: cyclic nucleotide-binding/CBS domain-containing protein [Gammaproteobacteria bacterium]|nr:cyclic nucleotide-binding/CBS domain-containing protein [Gammaproteobacteria bacterium]MCP5424310.1 cyclic nucleotide-binding/CBS domain-containing protein [Gammaproteobacteria bacterium]MCP5459063.1 cyclic nucleotide-binding/CBS domain-containing protein [Gammaproteobacteria bacterium]